MRLDCYVSPPQNLGTDWDERVLPSIGNEIVKAVVAQYNAEQLLTQRDKVSKAVGTPAARRSGLCLPCSLSLWLPPPSEVHSCCDISGVESDRSMLGSGRHSEAL